MKRRYLMPILALMITIIFFSFPFNFVIAQNNLQIPIALNDLKNPINAPNNPRNDPISDNNITLKTMENQPDGGEGPDRFVGQNATNTVINYNITKSSYDNGLYTWYDSANGIIINTGGWNITFVNFTFFNIAMRNFTFDVETTHNDFQDYTLPDLSGGNLYFMSFKLEKGFTSFLTGLDIYLHQKALAPSKEIRCKIFNASYNAIGGRAEPQAQVSLIELTGTISFGGIGGFWEWIKCSNNFNIFLNTSETYNSTFFVLPYVNSGSSNIHWGYANDPPDNGYAYQNSSTSLTNLSIDFTLKNINITYSIPKPSQMNMRVNGTLVTDGPYLYSKVNPTQSIYAYSGYYINYSVSEGKSGRLFYNVTTNSSDIMIFMLNATGVLENQTNAVTICSAWVGNLIVNWNATVQGVEFPIGSFAKRIRVTIPFSWNVSGVYYQNNTPETWIIDPSIDPLRKIVKFDVTANGSWVVVCNGMNWAGVIKVFNSTDFGEAYSYYLNDSIIINGTINTSSMVKANLTIFSPINTSVYTDLSNISNNVASFKPWQIIKNSTSSGTHYLRVVWFNGTEVSINMTTISCYNETTNLTVFQGPDPPLVVQGDPVTARIFYNDTYNNSGIPGAMIISNWSYSSLNIIDYNNGSYNITFLTAFAPIDNYTVIINASKAGFDIAMTIINFNVTTLIILEPTELKIVGSIPYTGYFLYVNDTGKNVIINYTVKLNGTGIKGASIMTTPDWSDPYFQAEDLSYVNASQNGLYRIWLDTTGTHAYELHSILFYATKPGYEPAANQSSPFQIRPIPTAIDVTGYENITKFEGETANIAAYYKDNYHAGNPAIINAQVNWTINTTIPKNSSMQLNIVIYEGIIDLPGLAIPPGTYNVTIKAQAPDCEFISRNITLNVLQKWNTTIWISNYSSDLRVGKDVTIAAVIEFSNTSLNRSGLTLFYDINYLNGIHYNDFRITNSTGVTTYIINPIPEIDWINVTVSYEGTPQICANSSWYLINVLSKYQTNITIFDEHLGFFIISGKSVSINSTLVYDNLGTWTAFPRENIEFIVDYGIHGVENFILTTNGVGNATLQFTAPVDATSVIIHASYTGNSSFNWTTRDSRNITITRYNLTIILTSINPLEVMVGSPLLLTCRVINTETLNPMANVTVTFFIYLGDPSMRLMSQSAVTDQTGTATTALILLQPFEVFPFLTVGVEYAGDDSNALATATSQLPIIPMTTTKYLINYVNQNWWWIATLAGAIITASLAYRYGVKLPAKRREVALQKKITNKIKDSMNLKHAMVLHKETGTAIYGQGFGIELNADLISGFLSALSAFHSEIGVKKEGKAAEAGGFELNYADYKILLTDGELSRFALITQERASDNFRSIAKEAVDQFEKEYQADLKNYTGALKPFKSANRLLEAYFETGIQSSFIVKSLSKKESKGLSDLSLTLVKIAKSEQDKKGNFTIDNIIKIAIPARKEPDYAIYYAIYNLYKNQIFRPFGKAESIDNIEELKSKSAEISKEPTTEKEGLPADNMELLKGLIIPNFKAEEYQKLNQEIKSMSPTNQKLFTKEIMFTPDDKRTKIVKNILKERDKSRINLKQNLSELENLKNKESPPYDEIFQRMETIKLNYEELGDEEKASLLAMDMQDILTKFDNIKEIKELRLKIAIIIKDADLAKNKKDYLKAALLYRKAGRLYIEIGDNEQALQVGEIANSCEQQNK